MLLEYFEIKQNMGANKTKVACYKTASQGVKSDFIHMLVIKRFLSEIKRSNNKNNKTENNNRNKRSLIWALEL